MGVPKQDIGLVPADAGVRYGHAVFQLVQQAAVEALVAGIKVAFQHAADDVHVARRALLDDGVQRYVLLTVVFVGIAMAAIHHHLRRHASLVQQFLRRGDRLCVVVGAVSAAAHHQVAIFVAVGVYDAGLPEMVDAEECVLGLRGNHRVHGNLRVSVGAVLEADGHAQTARHLAVRLALGRACANRRPRNQPGEILRHDGVEELGRGVQAHLVYLQQQPSRASQPSADVEGIVQIRVVNQPLPADRGSRLLEVNAHHEQDAVAQFVLQRLELLRVFERRVFVMHRAWADDDHEARVFAAQHCLYLPSAFEYIGFHIRGQRKLFDKPNRAD